MDGFDFNGGNAEIMQVDSSLENIVAPETLQKQNFEQENKLVDQEINGDAKLLSNKKNIPPAIKKKLRKLKTGTLGSIEEIHKPEVLSLLPKSIKRKISETLELSSSESEEFNGFDHSDLELFEPDNIILKKLIAEAELINNASSKRRKITIASWKHLKNADNLIEETDENTTDSEDQKTTTESDHYHVNADELSLKSEKSVNSNVSLSSNRSRKSRSSRGTSPGIVRQKVPVDITNPTFREPFNYGWKRELVYRAGASENQGRRMADIYYYTPEGKKVRSYREVIEFLKASELTIDNFTFFKEPLGINDPNKEIIRDAKKAKDCFNNKVNLKLQKKSVEILAVKRITPKKLIDKFTTVTMSMKTSPKTIKTSSPTLKVKIPPKKGILKREVKLPSCNSSGNETSSSPPWNPLTTRRNQSIIEKIPPTKSKKIIKKKQIIPDIDNRQYFMVSVCAGYHALSRVFQYLKVQELLRAARVCRMWRDLAAHPSLWKTVRMKNSQVTDWDGLADTLKNRGTQHLDLRKMLIVGETDNIWKQFVTVIPRVKSLTKLELCRCPAMVVEEILKNCPQLKVLSAMSIRCDSLDLESINNLKDCNELRLKAINGMSLRKDLTPLLKLFKITHLSLTSIKDLGKQKIEIIKSLGSLEVLELGECSDFPEKFGTSILIKLQNLERLRLEKGQGSCCTFDILEGISKLEKLTQLELVNFDVKNGFDKYLANCKNIKRLLIIPTYVSQSATSNNMILGGVTELSSNLTHFVWGVTQELLRVTELFVDQCNQMNKQITGDSIPVLKPVPCLKLIEDTVENKLNHKDDKQQPNLSNPQVEILPLPHLQKLLLTALPKTRVKILKIPFHATWRQSISDSTSQ